MKTVLPAHSIIRTRRLLPILIVLGMLLASALPSAVAGPFLPGEILIAQEGTNNIQRYSTSGTLLQTFSGTGTNFIGASLTPDGNLVTVYALGSSNSSPSGINIFSPNGTQITTFTVPATVPAGDVSVFANGTLAVCNHLNGSVQFWNQTGTLLKTISGLGSPWGSTIGSDGLLYVGDHDIGKITRINSSGTVIDSRFMSFTPGDLVMNPLDGTLWASGYANGLVEHIRTTGSVISSFAAGLSGSFGGIGLAPDDLSLYVTSKGSTVVNHFDLNGNLLDSFALTSPNFPLFLTVVPNPTPEPGSATLLLGGLALLAARRRRAST